MQRKANEDKIREQFIKIMKELQKWPEDKVKKVLKQKLEDETWMVSTVSYGTEHGKDLEATKGPRTIIIEAKGEPKSPNTYQQQRRGSIRGAFASIIQYMRENNPDRVYCIAFPNNDYYPRHTQELIPRLVRTKLALSILFVDENGLLNVLLPDAMEICQLRRFDDLFNVG